MNYHLHGMAIPSEPTISPDGTRVAFVVTTIDSEEDEYRRAIWMADESGASRFTNGENDRSPSWSPDGTRLAFMRKVGETCQLAVIRVGGGEARVLTDFPLGTEGEPVWSPDGSAIAVVGVLWEPDWADLDEGERKRKPRRIARRDYRADGRGWIHDRRRFIHVVDLEDDQAVVRRLTKGTGNESGPAWSPDGSRLAYISDASDTPGYDPGGLVEVAPVAGGTVETPVPRGMWWAAGFRPDGVLHAIGYPGTDFPDLPRLWRFEPEPVCVSESHPRALFSFLAGAPRLAFIGDRAVVSNVDSGAVGVIAVNPEGEVEELIGGPNVVSGFDVSGEAMAATYSTIRSPGVLLVENGDAIRTFDDFGGRVPTVIEPHHFVIEEEGLDVWVYLPAGDDPVPLLLNIHGGPAGQYGWGYFDEFQVYASAGYGVVATNPRGSAGKDREFMRGVLGEGWGRVDVEDIDSAVAAALSRFPRLDPERMGVMGGSYGGFLTAWLVAHQERWSAAIVERALLSFPSFAGTSDIGGWFGRTYLGDPDLSWEKSPLRLAERVTTPTLVIHSEEDFRCPIEQAEQFFDVLLKNGVHAEFVRFPGEGHELSRSGEPRHREERFDIILEWLGRWLGGSEEEAGDQGPDDGHQTGQHGEE